MKESLKVGAAGVRGVVGDSFTPQLACAFAQAFGTFVGRGTVVVGRDTRPSGPMIEAAVVAGLQSVGCKPVLAGIAPTPTLLFLTKAMGARGGIAITASHNPAAWNALKFIEPGGIFLAAVRAEELFDIYHQQEFPLVTEPEIPAVGHRQNPTAEHFKKILDYVDAEAIRRRHFRVAVDCCNGVGALFSVPFLRDQLGCEVFAVYENPSGVFERGPEPLAENLSALCELVSREHCDIGFAQDPDGDRLALVSEAGQPLGEDMTIAFAMRQVLDAHEKGPVAINLTASKAVTQVATERGSKVIQTRVGETNVTEAILREGCVIGGEHTGGVIIPRIHPSRDGFAAMAVILELLAVSGKKPSEIRAEIPKFAVVRDKVPVNSDQTPAVLRALRRQYQECPQNLLDGLYVDFGPAWIHVRRSNTEPVFRITAEAATRKEAEELAAECRRTIEAELKA